MTQPNLLELAKQGDPQAIAALMNLTLEPKGVVAKAAIEDDCLYVFLSAPRVLNAQTLVTFVQKGILRLDVSSIQHVQVFGQRLEDEQPDWVETFAISRSQVADALEALSYPSTNASRHDAVLPPPTRFNRWKQRWVEQKQPLQVAFNNTLTASKRLAAQKVAQWRDRDEAARERDRDEAARERDRDEAAQEAPAHWGTKRYTRPYIRLSVLVTVIAFVTGGAVALIANSYTVGNADRKTRSTVSTIASNSQLAVKAEAERNREQQEATARNYLETMNKAQQSFYRQNNRFALTLEELERFAAVPIASRSDYLYKLTVPNSKQSQLTAVPKAEGLKSYTAAVAIAKPTNQIVTAICASTHAAKVPPLVFQATSGAVQCPI